MKFLNKPAVQGCIPDRPDITWPVNDEVAQAIFDRVCAYDIEVAAQCFIEFHYKSGYFDIPHALRGHV